MWSELMARIKLVLDRAPVDQVMRLKLAEEEAEASLREARTALAAAEEGLPTLAASAMLSGKEGEFRDGQSRLRDCRTAVQDAESLWQGFRQQRQQAEANALAAETLRRQREAERLLSVEGTDGMQKIQAGADLLIAGFRLLNTSTLKAKRTLPNAPAWWPNLWGDQLQGHLRRYMAARGGPLGGNTYQSDFATILAGPDLVQMHKTAVQEVLGSPSDSTEIAA